MRFDKCLMCLLSVASMFFGSVAPSFAQDDGGKFQNTVTSRRIYGWERNLTVRDPNLAKWHWDPIVANQYNRRVLTVKPPTPGAPEGDKPAPPAAVYKQHYVKPIHVALPVVNHGPITIVSNSNSDLNGKLLSKPQTNNVDVTPAKSPASYGGDNHTNSAVAGTIATTRVNGTLLRMAGKKAALGSESPTASREVEFCASSRF